MTSHGGSWWKGIVRRRARDCQCACGNGRRRIRTSIWPVQPCALWRLQLARAQAAFPEWSESETGSGCFSSDLTLASTRFRSLSRSFCNLDRGCCCCEAWTRRSRSFCSSSWVISLLLIGNKDNAAQCFLSWCGERKTLHRRDVASYVSTRQRGKRVANRSTVFGLRNFTHSAMTVAQYDALLRPGNGGQTRGFSTSDIWDGKCRSGTLTAIPDRPGLSRKSQRGSCVPDAAKTEARSQLTSLLED